MYEGLQCPVSPWLSSLQTKHGVSIINGNWVIDRPGIYTAVGTQLMYKRPNEIRSRMGESITTPGPLSEDLILYLIYQQPNPSVYYEYSLPSPHTGHNPKPHEGSNVIAPGEITDLSPLMLQRMKHSVTTKLQTMYKWVQSGHSECSTTCGTGKREEREGERERMCSLFPPFNFICPTPYNITCGLHSVLHLKCSFSSLGSWDIGEWSECSAKCGPGTQQRQVICRQVTQTHANGTETSVTVALEQCGSTEMPDTKSTCQLKICSQWEVRSEWTPCSVPCGVGQRSREVVCVSNQGELEPDKECNMNIKPDTLQNCDMGKCARSWFTSQWSQQCTAACGRGNRTRTAVCLMDYVTDLPLGSFAHESGPGTARRCTDFLFDWPVS
uniref:ADAMTS/ADAMTS-like Spacer 1 domain-containing protein n=1 Tax=Periophthalmus magnuspinnatus TaxID=409849 RepID=A0A3B4BJG2_9GOBI